jgi:hypothetical protein
MNGLSKCDELLRKSNENIEVHYLKSRGYKFLGYNY